MDRTERICMVLSGVLLLMIVCLLWMIRGLP